jgi:hypothetical protein
MIDSLKITFFISLVLVLSACGVHIGSVKQTPTKNLVVLRNNYEYTRDRNTPFCDERFTYRAFAGTYYPEFEDGNGVYYRGRAGSIQFEPLKVSCMKELPKASQFKWVGIYLPKNQSLPALMYVYSGKEPAGYIPVVPEDETEIVPAIQPTTPVASGLIPALILDIERNSIQFLRFQADDDSLRKAITIIEKPTQ